MTQPPLRPGSLPGGPRSRVPSDLAPGEADVAAWFQHLDRPAAPATVRRALLEGETAAVVRPARAHGLRAFPLGAWGVASAALLLLALGVAVTVEIVDPVQAPQAGGGTASSVRVVEDVSMPLFHDLETFDDVGLPRGELLADWGR